MQIKEALFKFQANSVESFMLTICSHEQQKLKTVFKQMCLH